MAMFCNMQPFKSYFLLWKKSADTEAQEIFLLSTRKHKNQNFHSLEAGLFPEFSLLLRSVKIAQFNKNIASSGPLPARPGWVIIIFDYQYFHFICPLWNAYEHLAMHLMCATYFGVLCILEREGL